MPGPNDPYQYSDLRNYALTDEQREKVRQIALTAGKILVPGLTSALTFDAGQFAQNVPGLDFILNPQKYPSNASLLNSTGWTTYNTRKEKEAAGMWEYKPYTVRDNDDAVTIASQNGISAQQLLDANPGGFPASTGQTIRLPQYREFTQPTQTQPTQPIQPTPAGNTDYSKTQAAQNYAKNKTPFLNQLRYDPETGDYVSIGRLLKQGKLDLKGNWHKQSNRQRRTGAIARKKQRQQKQDNTLTNSFISFGASSG